MSYTDPSGKDLVSALIGGIIGAIVGGVTAWEEGYGPTTWQFWGDVGLDAGIGALAGAGDFAAWAGITPGALAGEGLSGAAQAAIIGGVNAGVAGFITGFGNSLINGGSGQSAFLSGFEGLGSGLVLGGVMSYIGYSFQQEAAQAAAQQQQLDAFQQNLDIQQFQSQSNIQNPLQVATEDVAANTSNNTTVPSNTPSVLASDQESSSLFSNSSSTYYFTDHSSDEPFSNKIFEYTYISEDEEQLNNFRTTYVKVFGADPDVKISEIFPDSGHLFDYYNEYITEGRQVMANANIISLFSTVGEPKLVIGAASSLWNGDPTSISIVLTVLERWNGNNL